MAQVAVWLAQAGLPFLLLTYLGMRSGGLDEVVRGEAGIAVWWLVLLGAAVGILPFARLSRGAWLMIGLAAAFAAWTALGIAWSESAERSVAEVGRVTTLIGVLVLGLSVQDTDGLRRMVGGVAAAIALLAGIALLSRLYPGWFPEREAPAFIPESRDRLHYPLNHWNGLAAFTAIGMPLLLTLATEARREAARALAVAAVPVAALVMFFTLSRGGAIAAGTALLVLFAVHPRRLALTGQGAVAGVGSAVLILAASTREALTDGLTDVGGQGGEMLALTVGVCLAVALAGRGMARVRLEDLPRPALTRRRLGTFAAAAAVLAIAVATAAGVPGEVADAWEDFKDPAVPEARADRFDSASGSGRYQFWETALEANATDPLVGIGPGTYQFFWAQEGSLPVFITEAHSLYLETLAELGVIGLLLLLAVVACPFIVGGRRLGQLELERRGLAAAALAACAAFAVAAAIDWIWELTVVPVAFLLLAAAVVGVPRAGTAGSPRRVRIGLAALALAGLVVIGFPLASTDAVRDSQADARTGDLTSALDEANAATDLAPYAAAPRLQEALVLELQGDAGAAVAAAREATERESINWRTWVVLSRLERTAGNLEASAAAYQRARELNPRSPLFEQR